MFDCALHFRFLQKASEAMFEMGQASVAAALACQSRLCDELTGQASEIGAVASPTSWFNPSGSLPFPTQASSPAQHWLPLSANIPLWSDYASAFDNGTATAAAWNWGNTWMTALSDWHTSPAPKAAFALWGVSPWSVYQGPMIATMLSCGVPYAVAAPTARASTSALDAADAVRAQWNCIFGDSSGERRQDKPRRTRYAT